MAWYDYLLAGTAAPVKQKYELAQIEARKKADVDTIDAQRRSRDIEHVTGQQEQLKFLTTALKARNPGLDDASAAQQAMNAMAQMATSKGMADAATSYNTEQEATGYSPFAKNVGMAKGEAAETTGLAEADRQRLEGAKANVLFNAAPQEALAGSARNTSALQLDTARNQALLPNAGAVAALEQGQAAATANEGMKATAQRGQIREQIPTSAIVESTMRELSGDALKPFEPLLRADPYGPAAKLLQDPDVQKALTTATRKAAGLTNNQPLSNAPGVTPKLNINMLSPAQR